MYEEVFTIKLAILEAISDKLYILGKITTSEYSRLKKEIKEEIDKEKNDLLKKND